MGRPTTSSSPGARARRGRGARRALAATVTFVLLLLFAPTAEAAKSGKLLYAKRIGSSTTEANAWAVAAGPKGVTALAGWQKKSGIHYPMVAQYTSAGKRAWLRTCTVVGEGHAHDVAFDRSGNVYVAATVEYGISRDIVVLKYSASGVLLWATKPYDGGEKDHDSAVKLAVDAKGDVIVVGQSERAWRTGIVVLKYKQKSGKRAWKPTCWDPDPDNPHTHSFDAADLALDGKGDIYVAGSVSYTGVPSTAYTFASMWKARGSDGAELKTWGYKPPNGVGNSFFGPLTVRGSSVVATGSVWDEDVDKSTNALIVKFDRGLREKARRTWGVGNTSEEAFGEAVIDDKGSVFVTGRQWVAGKYSKAVTLKLDAKLKKVVWSTTYMPASKYADGDYIARDSAGNVYVGGLQDVGAPTAAERYFTIKYSAAGARKWVRAWPPGEESTWYQPAGLVLGSKDGVYVGGYGVSKAGVEQAVLLKYQR